MNKAAMNRNTIEKKKSLSENNFPLILSKATILMRNNTGKLSRKRNKNVVLPQINQPNINSNNSSISYKTYKYKLYPGNNSRVILNSLRKRPWWHPSITNTVSKSDNDISDDELVNLPNFIWQMNKNNKYYLNKYYNNVLLNHIQNNQHLVSKKGLYYSIKEYCQDNKIEMTTIIPLTFYLSTTSRNNDDKEQFLSYNQSLRDININKSNEIAPENNSISEDLSESTVWILKPASYTNRGFGIKVVKGMNEVFNIIQKHEINNSKKVKANNKSIESNTVSKSERLSRAASRMANQNGYIVQLYMNEPILLSGRKFDIRCFVLVTIFNKKYQAYFFDDLYIRTSSKKYNLTTLQDKEIHLTNDAIQKHSKSYGKYENGNKLTIDELENNIKIDYPNEYHSKLINNILESIKNITKISLLSCKEKYLNTKINNSFELYGYDYMIDKSFQPYLIEVNTNPCLEFACPLLTSIISSVIENTIRMTLDKVYPIPNNNEYISKTCQDSIDIIQSEEIKFKPLFD